MTAFDSLLQDISTKFGEGEAADVLHELKKRYPSELFDQDDLYGALKQLHLLGAIDDDGDTKLLEMLAEKTSKKDQVLELINGHRESVPPCKNDFVGRDDDVKKIMKLVANSRVPGINLFGESGVGKTTLAKEVCKQLKDFETLSIDLRDIKDVKAVYFLVLQEFHLPAWGYSKERIYEHLEGLTRKTFLILDNIEQLLSKDDTADQEMRAEFLEFLLAIISTEASKRGRLKIILTSRMEIIEPSLKAKLFGEYKVNPFSKEVSKAFISRRLKEDFDVSSTEQDEALTEISELCRDTPYLLQGAEQLIRENYCTPVQVLQKITTQIEKGVPKEFACISALFDSIPNDLLKQVAVKISLLRRPFSRSTAIKIAELSSDHDARFDLEMLVKHKIITAEDVEGKRKYDLHALFREFVTSYLCKEHSLYKKHLKRGESQFFEHFSGKLTKLVEYLDIDFVKMYKKLEKNRANFELTVEVAAKYETLDLLLHSEDLRKNVPVAILFEYFKKIEERRNIFKNWAEIFESKGKWLSSANMTCWESIQLADMEGTQLAYKTLKKAEMLLAMALLTSTPDQLKASEGFYRYCSGKINYMSSANLIDESSTAKKEELLSQALRDLEESLDIHKEVYGNHTLTARTLNLMGNCYMELDQPENAETFYLEAIDMKVKLVGSNRHCDIPTYYNQLSQVHEALGNTEIRRKKSLGQRIIEFISRPFKSVQERQQYELAVVFSKKALDLQKELGVDDSDDTATFQRNLANILIGLEQYDEALKFAKKSYEIRNSRLGRHPETVRILYLIGIIHEWRKDHNAALQSYEKAFEMEKSLPEDNHSVVRRHLCDRLEEMCKKTKKKDKLKKYERSIESIRKIEDHPPGTSYMKEEDKAETLKTNEILIDIDETGGCYDFSEKCFFLNVPRNAVNQAAKVKCSVYPNYFQSPTAGITYSVSYFVQMSSSNVVQLHEPITLSLMHSGAGEEYGYETVVKAFNQDKFTWEDLEELKRGSVVSRFGHCRTDFIQVQISRLTVLATVTRLITDRFEVTPTGCIVKSSVCSDVTLEFPEGAVDKTVNGTMKLLLMMESTTEKKNDSYQSPILFIDGFEKINLQKCVTIRIPHPCPAKYPVGKLSLMCLKDDKASEDAWEDITDQITYVEQEASIELQVQHFSGLWLWIPIVSLSMLSVYKYLISLAPYFVHFALLKKQDGDCRPIRLFEHLKVTLLCVANHDDEKVTKMEGKGYQILSRETSQTPMRPGDKALIEVEGDFKHQQTKKDNALVFIKNEKVFKELDVSQKIEETQTQSDRRIRLIVSLYNETNNDLLCQLSPDETEILKNTFYRRHVYEMWSSSTCKKGVFVIVNYKFDDQVDAYKRKGSEVDVKNLEDLCTNVLGFEMIPLYDRNGQDLLDKLHSISDKRDFINYNCFALCIMSHGENNFFYTSDGIITFSTIQALFNNSKNFRNKPKLFFFQACRNKLKNDSTENNQKQNVSEKKDQENNAVTKDVPVFSLPDDKHHLPTDILMVYSCFEGCPSHRNKEEGSFFIQSLVRVFKEYVNEEDVLSMITMVSNELSSQLGEKQVPQTYTTLTKKLFFKPELKFRDFHNK